MTEQLGGDAGGPDSDAAAAQRKPGRLGRLPIVLGAAVVLLGLLLAALTLTGKTARPGGSDASAAYASLGGPFEATDQNGRPVDQTVLKGKWSAVFFGYVTCPDICPATLQALALTQEKLGADAGRFQVVFASVDPQRDTPALIKTYLAQDGYPPHALGLTGTVAQMERLEKAYRAYASITPRSDKDGGGYDVSHSGAIYLVNPQGVTVGALTESMGPDAMAAQVKAAMKGRA